MRSKRRRELRRQRPTDVYRLVSKHLSTNWLVAILSGIVFFVQLIFGAESGFTFIRSVITLFMGMIFIQSIRAIIQLTTLKKMLLANPHSVTEKQVSSAPNIKSLFWLP